MHLLTVSGIQKWIGGEHILKGISFKQDRFQNIAIVGESGSGKSTLLRIVSGFTQADEGEVLFEKQKVKGPMEKLIPGHSGIAYLSQHYELRNNYKMAELLQYANKLPAADAAALYKVCRIDHLLGRKNDQISGGEQQRIALARLLVTAPRLLLLDEPFSNLDLINKNILKSVIRELSEKLKITCLLVSHDPTDILPWADQIMVMKDGAVIQKGSPWQVYKHPVNEYAAGLFGKFNQIASNGKTMFVRPEDLHIVTGTPNTLMGKVKKVHFLGNAFELEVMLLNELVTIRTIDSSIKAGDTVHVALAN
ncbi:ABC transporter ATP-binding protein [Chitinophaga alhagiae]|uniref:ABC transporter ATP-binding protein n=1 Tax=Chitinophaga alhagiae TaxID=2203219 RepID=A0ABM6W8T9_9BACT|nr:ABC transporter ATP-binding protein [Chitinophaga alhagiae]AWO00309.1 ABC transporter ATP-binding protein [Chitinophaga alhagiae]